MAKKQSSLQQFLAHRPIPTFGDALDAAEPRKATTRDEKRSYAQRLSDATAVLVASRLRKFFPQILPNDDGTGTESRARTGKGMKKLDVNYSTVQLGLGLGVSIKTLNYRDPKSKRYTKNPTRLDNELRAEAMDYHDRQPYSVLVALVIIPVDACDDGDPSRPKQSWSSFAQIVSVLRHRVGRRSARDEAQLFERGFVGLYAYEGQDRGTITFFDLTDSPRQFGRPKKLCELDGVVAQIVATYDDRNRVKRPWEEVEAVPFDELVNEERIADEEESEPDPELE